MSTFLLTFNPKHWLDSELVEHRFHAEKTAKGTPHEMRWSTGNRRNVQKGDRLFIVREGLEPKGIFAAGWAIGDSFESEHWDEEKNSLGKRALYVSGRFERLLNAFHAPFEPILSISSEKFLSEPLSKVKWLSQASGILIEAVAAALLEKEWEKHLAGLGFTHDHILLEKEWENHLAGLSKAEVDPDVLLDPDADTFTEGRTMYVLHRRLERCTKVVDLAKVLAKKKTGRLTCGVCEFDFEAIYGDVGKDFIEGHHTMPISEIAGLTNTKVSDISLVCSNWHRMLHRRRPWLRDEQLKDLLRQPPQQG